MNKHHRVIGVQFLHCKKSVVYRLLPCLPAGNDGFHLCEAEPPYIFAHLGNPAVDTDNHDSLNIVMILKFFQRIDDDRLPVEFEKLLRDRSAVHPFPAAARKNQCNIFHFPVKLLNSDTKNAILSCRILREMRPFHSYVRDPPRDKTAGKKHAPHGPLPSGASYNPARTAV